MRYITKLNQMLKMYDFVLFQVNKKNIIKNLLKMIKY